MKAIFTSLILIAALFLIIDTAVAHQITQELELRFFDAYKFKPLHFWRTALLGVTTIMGILCGHLYSNLGPSTGTKPVGIAKTIKSAIRQNSLWRSFLASPIIFSLVYSLTKEQPDIVLASFLAFENGFFCEAILKKRTASSRRSPKK